MSARLLCPLALVAACALSGCYTKRIYSAEREEGRTTSLDWRIGEKIENAPRWNPESEANPPLAPSEAVRVANEALENQVKTPAQWSLAYCRIVELQKGCHAYAVRFDRKGAFDDAQAGDRFVKFYVLFDKSLIVPTISYDR